MLQSPQPILAFGSLSGWEMIVIAMVALLLFGHRLPEVMRSLGRGVVEFKRGLNETQQALERHVDDRRDDAPAPRPAITTQPPAPGPQQEQTH